MAPHSKNVTMRPRWNEAAPWPPIGVLTALASAVATAGDTAGMRPVGPDGRLVLHGRPTNDWSPDGRPVALLQPGHPRLEVLDGLRRKRLRPMRQAP